MSKLPDFEGRPVRKSSVRITKAGDGLSEALKLAPVALHHDDEVFFVLKGRCTQINHKPVEADSEDLVRVQTVEATEIAIVHKDDVDELLADAAERVEQAKEEARLAEEQEAGILRLPEDDDEDGGDQDEEDDG